MLPALAAAVHHFRFKILFHIIERASGDGCFFCFQARALKNASFFHTKFYPACFLNMLSLYYKIWVDAIRLTKSSKTESENWKMFTIIPISVLQGVNLLTLLFWIRWLSHKETTVVLPMNLFNVVLLNDFVSVILTFFLPFVILNYLLIFYNNKYSQLLKTYTGRGGKLYLWYMALTLGVFSLPYVFRFCFEGLTIITSPPLILWQEVSTCWPGIKTFSIVTNHYVP
jgi:hypothetical protein